MSISKEGPIVPRMVVDAPLHTKFQGPLPTLLGLPTEVHLEIISHLAAHYPSAVNMALVNQHFSSLIDLRSRYFRASKRRYLRDLKYDPSLRPGPNDLYICTRLPTGWVNKGKGRMRVETGPEEVVTQHVWLHKGKERMRTIVEEVSHIALDGGRDHHRPVVMSPATERKKAQVQKDRNEVSGYAGKGSRRSKALNKGSWRSSTT
jgi:hypothetical protein